MMNWSAIFITDGRNVKMTAERKTNPDNNGMHTKHSVGRFDLR
jgi:hypothetical protein